eukprot:scaffold1659_cov255-Pinguiococcus_pyrenoidosus.AAC.54
MSRLSPPRTFSPISPVEPPRSFRRSASSLSCTRGDKAKGATVETPTRNDTEDRNREAPLWIPCPSDVACRPPAS